MTKKLKLEGLKVHSFITTLDEERKAQARGGITTFALLGCSWGTGACCQSFNCQSNNQVCPQPVPVPIDPAPQPQPIDTHPLDACNPDTPCYA